MPRLVTCPHCGRVHSTVYHCSDKPRRKYVRKEVEKGRYTSAWHQKSEEIKERSNYLCAVCLDNRILTYDGLEVHHIVKIADRPELLLEDSNLICLCVQHHKRADRGCISPDYLMRLARLRDTPPPIDDGLLS